FGTGSEDLYVKLTVQSTGGKAIAVEQFDVSAVRPVFGFGDGWYEHEYNPRTGLQWRWMSERNDIRVHLPVPANGSSAGVVLAVEGESPLRYFSRPSRLVIRVGDTVLREEVLGADFSLTTSISRELFRDAVSTITLETDQTYVPAERSRRTQDRRHL